MLVSAGVLVGSALLSHVVARREKRRPGPLVAAATAAAPTPACEGGTFALVFRHKYLTLIAVFSVLFTMVNTNGEYILGTVVSGWAKSRAAAEAAGGAERAFAQDLMTGFYGEFFLYVNVAVVVLQTFVVSRIVKYGGLRLAFFVMPVIALLDAVGIALAPVLAVVRVGKIVENSTDYSVNNTVRNMLWLPTTTEMKYKAKQAVDTFFVRSGDVASALTVGLLAGVLHLGVRAFALVNVGLVVVWMIVARGIVRENARLSRT
jgi:ATP:ADP antiporter, AAA family